LANSDSSEWQAASTALNQCADVTATTTGWGTKMEGSLA